nr:MAG: hypothetical protein [Betatorquevirus sp.]
MSSVWKPPKSSTRQLENAWMNSTFQTHDLFCHCNDPWLHFMIVLNKNSNAPKPEPEIENIKWLLIGKPTIGDTATVEDHGFDDGDLERLFAEDGEEKENTTEEPKR